MGCAWCPAASVARLGILLLAQFSCMRTAAAATDRKFTISDDRFYKDGQPFQIISGEIHYFRIHPDQWEDRLLRARAMGLNTIQTYVAWNMHEVLPGKYKWSGFADLERYIQLIDKLGMLVLLRPGPYICAEWDFGGFPAWLASDQVEGGGNMTLRSHDPLYLLHVDRWFKVLMPKMAPYLYTRGGPIIMMQVENEFGFIGPDYEYMSHLHDLMRTTLGDNDTILYTTDPPDKAANGGYPGYELLTVVDFGFRWITLPDAFGTQRNLNAPGRSPPMCSEFYAGWLTPWGEAMANKSTIIMADTLAEILRFGNNSGNVNLYMAHGGTNFGFRQGGTNTNAKGPRFTDGQNTYSSWITSYDYDAPISEAGATDQPGIGGDGNKYLAIREVIANHTGVEPPPMLPAPSIHAFGKVVLPLQASLLTQLKQLAPGDGIYADYPKPMEDYGEMGGLIVYRIRLAAADVPAGSALDFMEPVHDAAQVLLNGVVVGNLERNGGSRVTLPQAPTVKGTEPGEVVLDIVVEGMGRTNLGTIFDAKGLASTNVTLNGTPLRGWSVFPLPLANVEDMCFAETYPLPPPSPTAAAPAPADATVFAAKRIAMQTAGVEVSPQCMAKWEGTKCKLPTPATPETVPPRPDVVGPVFFKGELYVDPALKGNNSYFPDTYLSLANGWSRGLAFINGFNLGYYWPVKGPGSTLYVPGPVLKECRNSVILLEINAAPANFTVSFVDVPNFQGGVPAKDLTEVFNPASSRFAAFAQNGKAGGHLIA